MKIEIRDTTKHGIVQITTLDERWYQVMVPNKKETLFVPSSTWIASYYPKGTEFYKWLANKGWDNAEEIKQAAGNKGSKIHQAIEVLLNDNELNMNDSFVNRDTGMLEPLSVEEWECLMSFEEWYKEVQPEIINTEETVSNITLNYAGTQDFKCKINGEIWIVDWKTSSQIWPSHEIQISSYRHATGNEDVTRTGILQLGYKKNKLKKYKFTEIEDKMNMFHAAYTFWENENKDVFPKQKDYPLNISLKIEETKKKKKETAKVDEKGVNKE